MAEEPTSTQEGAELLTHAEDRAQAGALSSLDVRGEDESAVKKEVDTEALGKAMEKLDVKNEAKKKEEAKRAVKVDAKDVNLLVCSASDTYYAPNTSSAYLHTYSDLSK
jgi:hypothetical protein